MLAFADGVCGLGRILVSPSHCPCLTPVMSVLSQAVEVQRARKDFVK